MLTISKPLALCVRAGNREREAPSAALVIFATSSAVKVGVRWPEADQ
jgi:hypothetical protein